MLPFVFKLSTKIIFGEDTSSLVPELIKELKGTRALIVTDKEIKAAGLLGSVLQAFKDADLPAPQIFEEVPPDSNEIAVNAAAKLGANHKCDAIVAVGGGSVIDTAKVANICLSYGGDMFDYQGVNNLPTKLLPLIAVPTTAGTGSEVSIVATVKGTKENKKILFGSTFLAPDFAVLDPKLVATLPPRLTAATGFDALTHAIESLSAQMSTSSMTDVLCLESIRLIFANLESATKCGADLEVRAATLLASTMAGVAFTNTGVGLVHALAHAFGSRYNLHHGMANAVFLPHVMMFNMDAASHKYALAARYIGVTKSTDDDIAAKKLINAVRKLMVLTKLPFRLKDIGVPKISKQELTELAEQASVDPAIMFNPKESSLEEIMQICKEAY